MPIDRPAASLVPAPVSTLVSALVSASVRALVLLPALGLGLAGCTISQLSEDNQVRATRIAGKEHQLASDGARQEELRAQSQQLEAEVRAWEVSLGELQSELDRLQRRNAAAVEQTRAQSLRKEQLARQIRQYQDEAAALRRSGAGTGPGTSGNRGAGAPAADAGRAGLQERQKRLHQLQGKVRKALDLLLES